METLPHTGFNECRMLIGMTAFTSGYAHIMRGISKVSEGLCRFGSGAVLNSVTSPNS